MRAVTSYVDEYRYRDLRKFIKISESELARRQRVSRDSREQATRSLRHDGLPELAESLFDKPTHVRRACGGRWRVMLC